MVKETVVEQETRPMPNSVVCTCFPNMFGRQWNYNCPVHGYRWHQPNMVTWTASTPKTTLTVNGKDVARLITTAMHDLRRS